MSLTGKNSIAPSFQRFQSDDNDDFQAALNGAVGLLEDQNIAGVVGEPEVTIVLRHNGKANGNDKLVDVIVYIGDIPQAELIKDLNIKS